MIFIRSAGEAIDYLRDQLADEPSERLIVLFIDQDGRVRERMVLKGSKHIIPVDARQILNTAFRHFAMVLAHNHPSGRAEASPADITFTRHLAEGAYLIGSRVIDHLIFAGSEVFSMRAAGLL